MATDTQETSMTDDLEAAIAAVDSGQGAIDVDPVEHEQTNALPDVDAPVETDGAPAEPEASANDPTDPDPDAKDGSDSPQPEAETAAAPGDDAPSSWTADAKAKWNDIPAEIRAEINRRESDYHRGVQQYKEPAQFGQAMHQAIQPYAQNIQSSGVQPAQAINHLLMIEDKLRNGDEGAKFQTLLKIASDYGINIEQAALTQPDPRMWQLERQLQQERMARQQFQQSIEMQQQSAVQSEIEAFKSNPDNQFFDKVSDQMAVLLQSGMAQSLQDAYEQAVWARPDIRKSLIEQQRTDAGKAAQMQARQQRAQSAAGGIKGAAPSKSGAPKDGNLRDMIAAAVDGDV